MKRVNWYLPSLYANSEAIEILVLCCSCPGLGRNCLRTDLLSLELYSPSKMSDHDQVHLPNHREQSGVHSTNDDDLFDYDVGLDEVLNSIPTEPNRADADAAKESATSAGLGPSLGLDEEVKVSKRRQPIAKLDETR